MPRAARSHARRRRERAERDRRRVAHVAVTLDETALPVPDNVRAACEMLGLDPLYVANEGVMLAIVPEADAARGRALRSHDLGRDAVDRTRHRSSPVPSPANGARRDANRRSAPRRPAPSHSLTWKTALEVPC